MPDAGGQAAHVQVDSPLRPGHPTLGASSPNASTSRCIAFSQCDSAACPYFQPGRLRWPCQRPLVAGQIGSPKQLRTSEHAPSDSRGIHAHASVVPFKNLNRTTYSKLLVFCRNAFHATNFAYLLAMAQKMVAGIARILRELFDISPDPGQRTFLAAVMASPRVVPSIVCQAQHRVRVRNPRRWLGAAGAA